LECALGVRLLGRCDLLHVLRLGELGLGRVEGGLGSSNIGIAGAVPERLQLVLGGREGGLCGSDGLMSGGKLSIRRRVGGVLEGVLGRC
jgi:hypothetical protein